MASSLFSMSMEHAEGVASFLHDMEALQHDRDTSDVVFLISQKEVPVYAHRLILWNRCVGLRQYRHEFWSSHTTGSRAPLCIKYPQFDVDTFRQVMTYIYSGKLTLHETIAFRLLTVSRELGIEHLTQRCERYIISTLSLHNACAFYAAALQLDEETDSKQDTVFSSLTEECVRYIEENASQCVQTEGWLELPKHTLTTILASENFALEEEDIWRSVLLWAKYHAGVPLDKPTNQWTEHDKTLVCQALSGVIHHVKLLLIDSSVFAQEVEPTGAVPIELSLERYRYAALSHQAHSNEDKRLRPRINSHLFPNTSILKGSRQHYQRTLNNWYGNIAQRWCLIYKASKHGYSAEDFHRQCDGHSPTFVIIQGNTGNVCGGFSDVPWTNKAPSRGRFITSQKAFVFTLINKQGIPATKFPVSKPQCATVHHPNYGPVFGAGADLSVASHCQSGMECYSNLGHSYGGNPESGDAHKYAKSSTLMGDYNFNVKDYEVFTIINTTAEL